ncbi:hypothetical protein [Arsenicibacter rosenii]|uniref:Uncharacterized protein n=1 Tax=Arsenicibacter rosenii TaxID=1750698 RepID=A0A1S2VFE5_9BACT|nr:hypothetical protein [Arsenicibacter rosenii]OIN56618.1 hypothetical protein BLX24_23595 [Arsenicibacter rosenii]
MVISVSFRTRGKGKGLERVCNLPVEMVWGLRRRYNVLYTMGISGRIVQDIQVTSNPPLHASYDKDKSSERPGFDQEKATHLSDTVDYYVIWRLRGGSAAFDDFDVGWL